MPELPASPKKTAESSTKDEILCSVSAVISLVPLMYRSCWTASASVSAARTNRSGASGQPWRIPYRTSHRLDNSPLTPNLPLVPVCIRSMSRTNCSQKPNLRSVVSRNGWSNVS